MQGSYDPDTFAFYEREAKIYAARRQPLENRMLAAFIAKLPQNARVLELGCGGGQDAQIMLDAGFDVDPTDGSPALAAQAGERLGRPVRVMRFDELDAVERYDAVWANASLLHAQVADLPGLFGNIHRALRAGGLFFASFKAGEGEGRDRFGRYYNFMNDNVLISALARSGGWCSVSIKHSEGGGYDGVTREWLECWAERG